MEKLSYTQRSLLKMQSVSIFEHEATRKKLQKLMKANARKLDDVVHKLHESEFEKIVCLECANCCKTTSPAIYENDLRLMSKALRKKTAQFIDDYLIKDDDEDYVFKSTPCPFLAQDYYCSVYKSRPRACKEYPHTDRKRFYQILELTAINTKICPAAFNIIQNLIIEFNC